MAEKKEDFKDNSNEVKYEDVVKAVESLRASKKVLTMSSIREALGNQGSVTQIAKHLKKWVSLCEDSNATKSSSNNDSKKKNDVVVKKVKKDNIPDNPSKNSAPNLAQKNESLNSDIKLPENNTEKNVDDNSRIDKVDSDGLKSTDSKKTGLLRSKSSGKSQKEIKDNTKNIINDKSSVKSHQQKIQPRKKQTGPVDNYAEKAGFKEDYLTSQLEYAPLTTSELNKLEKNSLIIKVRQLQSVISREKSRTETAEKLASEANIYAQSLKEQISHRIKDLKDSMSEQLSQLKSQMRDFKQQSEEDLNYYRSQLEKATAKIVDNKN